VDITSDGPEIRVAQDVGQRLYVHAALSSASSKRVPEVVQVGVELDLREDTLVWVDWHYRKLLRTSAPELQDEPR
jgi:hypothetical protein